MERLLYFLLFYVLRGVGEHQGGECLVEVVARNLTKGRLMVTAATLAQPVLRTHSVATGALHWLPDIGG